MWFGGWEETLCPVKAPANIVSLLQEKIVAENMEGKNWKKYMKAKRERPWVKKKSVEKKKLSIWKKKTFMGRWRDINMHHILVRYSCLGSWELLHYFCNQNQIVTKRTVPGWSSLNLIFFFILWEFSFFVVRTFEKRQEDCFCLREHQNFTKKACTAYFHRNENKISPVILISPVMLTWIKM